MLGLFVVGRVACLFCVIVFVGCSYFPVAFCLVLYLIVVVDRHLSVLCV